MKIAFIGLPQTGKKTLFGLLTGSAAADTSGRDGKAYIGIVGIRDPRFDKLVSIYDPQKRSPAVIEVTLVPKIGKETIRSGELFRHIEETEAICHVVRAFESDEVYHVEGSVDPGRDIGMIESELILNDLLFVEKRFERMRKGERSKKGGTQDMEKDVLLKIKGHLEQDMPLRLLDLNKEEKRHISSHRFLTAKPMIVVLNISEGDLKGSPALEGLEEKCAKRNIDTVRVSARIEQELAGLDPGEEKNAFLRDMGVEEPAVDRLTRALHRALGFIFFFTGGKKEVHAWTVRRGAAAPEAAGAIHSDMEKGFIRAEVIKYADLARFGSEAGVREAGRLFVKGKDYIVEDGDILNIRFAV